MAYTTIDNPELYFQVKLYTGNATDDTAITLDGDENMQPDLVWIKNRGGTAHHTIFDSVRGATKAIYSNLTNAETTASGHVTAFGSDGFTLGDNSGTGNTNENTATYVAWCWKAGTAWSNDASATGVGTIDSSGSKNATSGFSIISFTGTETNSQSVAHSLSSTPEMILSRPREVVDNWGVFHSSFDAQHYLFLNTYGAKGSAAAMWSSLPSSTVINMGDNAAVNDDGDMIMYAWRSVQGFSKIGTYTGNANANGPMVWTGFRPAYVMFKKTSGSNANWQVYDNKRDTENPVDNSSLPDDSAADQTDQEIDFLSTGFKIRDTGHHVNGDGVVFIYMAFAEQPFVNSNGVPCNAR